MLDTNTSSRDHLVVVVDPSTAEACATDIVEGIRRLIDGLKVDFPPSAASTTSSSSTIPLFRRMEERGLVTTIRMAVDQQRIAWKGGDSAPDEDDSGSCSEDDDDTDDQRGHLLKTVLLPLFRSLTRCYQVLDALPQTPPSSSPRRDRTNKPIPPRGMLSIQQYTDIACLVEFIICTCILPQLDAHILTPIEERIQYHLPKSLAGRLPRMSLLWWSSGNPHRLADAGLLETTIVLIRLLSLDRFRPMLLPRHTPTLYAAIFQYEHNTQTTQPQLLQDMLQNGTDDTIKAKAYQTILQQGIKSPEWLRKRVGPLLTELACTNLASIVQVFVPLQQQHGGGGDDDEVSTMASQRLGRTLAPAGRKLGQQMRVLLEVVFPTMENGRIPAHAQAILQTIWSILLQWPAPLLQQEFIEPWESGLQRNGDHVHRTVRQMGSLCAWIPPPATRPWTVLQFLFPMIWNSLVRVASMKPTVIVSQTKQDARQVLHWLCQATVSSSEPTIPTTPTTTTTTTTDTLPSGLALLASAWVEGMTFNSWDLDHSYQLNTTQDDKGPSGLSTTNAFQLEKFNICNSTNRVSDLSSIVEDMQRRIDLLFDVCLVPNGPESLYNLSSMLFRLLLKIYLSRRFSFPDGFVVDVSWRHELVASLLLPTLCDKRPPEELLFGRGSGTDAMGLLQSIRTILVCAQERLTEQHQQLTLPDADQSNRMADVVVGDEFNMIYCLQLLQRNEKQKSLERQVLDLPKREDEKDQDDTLVSIASIVLSLLIALLELGPRRRSENEEDALQSFLPVLETLAGHCSRPVVGGGLVDSSAGISDMAGYALSLIASRTAEASTDPEPQLATATSPREKLEAILQEAEADLASPQPPLRARGMVSLGRLARGYLGILDPQQRKPKLVSDVMEESNEDDLVELTIREVLRLSMVALADDESYVYLAAVQTVVAVGDLMPQQVLPLLATAVVTGSIAFFEVPLGLSNEQRIKLGEALMFIIRRRAAVDAFVPMLVSIMIFGSPDSVGNTANCPDYQMQKHFAEETDKYFVGSPNESMQEKKEHWEERDTRVRTGGPLFDLEEDDIVRSMRISMLAELASVAAPFALAPYAKLLVRLVTDAIRLDKSRTVRRTAALLAREFYGCLLREQDTVHHVAQNNADGTAHIRLAMALASIEAEEELLSVTLQSHAAGTGVDESVFDPATQSRCQEALHLREEAEIVMSVAKLRLAQQEEMSNLPALLSSMIQERPPIPEIDKISF